MEKPRIAVIGHTGMIGSVTYDYLKNKKIETYGYSVDKRCDYPNTPWKKINELATVIFVCVPTPYDFGREKENFGIVDEVLREIKGEKTIVIRSTVWPGTTDKFQEKYPKHKLLFNPEFLSRKSAKLDFEKPDRQIVGYTKKSRLVARGILELLPDALYSKIMRAAEAELVKYGHNVYGAMRVTYANHLYEVSESLGIDHKRVLSGVAASKYAGGFDRYTRIFNKDGKRGFGGPCFPKDVASYLKFCRKYKIDPTLVASVRKMNKRILAEQKMSERDAEEKL